MATSTTNRHQFLEGASRTSGLRFRWNASTQSKENHEIRFKETVKQIKPSFTLEVANEVYVTKAREELTIPVKIVRQDGFDQPIHVTALGLPVGIRMSGATSIPEDASAKEVKLRLMAAQSIRGSFQIIGTTRSSNRHVLAHTAATVAGHTTSDFWLTVTESKTDQGD